MTPENFAIQVQRLRETWGQDRYPKERVKEFWEKLKDMPDFWFTSCCSDFVGNSLKPPMLKEFLADAEDFKRREATKRIQSSGEAHFSVFSNGEPLRTTFECSRCNDHGWVLAPREEGPDAVYRCTCTRGEAGNPQIPQWRPRLVALPSNREPRNDE